MVRTISSVAAAIVWCVWAIPADARQAAAAADPGLKIVVIEGEEAVNVVQQRSAVASIIEVRDRDG